MATPTPARRTAAPDPLHPLELTQREFKIVDAMTPVLSGGGYFFDKSAKMTFLCELRDAVRNVDESTFKVIEELIFRERYFGLTTQSGFLRH